MIKDKDTCAGGKDAVSRLGPWIFLLLGVIFFASAFLGSSLAGDLFNSPAMASVWILLFFVAVYVAARSVMKRNLSLGLFAAGLAVLIAAAMWGSQPVITLANRFADKKFPSVFKGKVLLATGSYNDDIYDLHTDTIVKLPFKLRCNDCGVRWHGRPSIYYRQGDKILTSQIGPGAKISLAETELEVADFLSWAIPVYPADNPHGPTLNCIDAGGKITSIPVAAGNVLKCPTSGAEVRILSLSRQRDSSGAYSYLSSQVLNLDISLKNADKTSQHLLGAGQYMDLPDLSGEQLYYRDVRPVGITSASPGDSDSRPYGMTLNISDSRGGTEKTLSFCFTDYDLPLKIAGPSNEGQSEIIISRPSQATAAQVWADVDILNNGKSENFRLEVNQPLVYGGYRFYVTEPMENGTLLALNVSCDRGRRIAFVAMGMIVLSLLITLVKTGCDRHAK